MSESVLQELHYYFQEKIVWVYFQLSRKKTFSSKLHLELHCKLFLRTLQSLIDNSNSEWLVYLDLFARCICYCRDSYVGLGERDLCYMLIYTLHEYFPRTARYLICLLIHKTSTNDNRLIGCWKDMPNFCQYVYQSSSEREKHPLISFCIILMNDQLKNDLHTWKYSEHNYNKFYISNLCKHLPREKSKFDWLYTKLVIHWANAHKPYILKTPNNLNSYNRALSKCKRMYRKIVSTLHKTSPSTSFLMSHKNQYNLSKFQHFEHNEVSIHDYIYHNFFFHQNKHNDSEKTIFQETYHDYMQNWMQGKIQKHNPKFILGYNHTNLSIYYLVKRAIYFYKSECINNEAELKFINSYWLSLFKDKKNIDYFLPLLDVSNTLDNDSFCASLAAAMYASRISKLDNCLVAVDKIPTWISIPTHLSFYEQICYIMENIYNLQNNECNYNRAIQLVIHTLKETNVTNHFIENIKLFFLTTSPYVISEKEIQTLFQNNGFSCFSKLIYWNFSQETILNLPCEINSNHSLLFSGYSLSPFFELYQQTSIDNDTYSFIQNILNHKRYLPLSHFLLESF